MGCPTFTPKVTASHELIWSPNPTTCLIHGPIWPTIPNHIHTWSAIVPQCTKQTDIQTNKWIEGMFDDYRPLSLYKEHCGLKIHSLTACLCGYHIKSFSISYGQQQLPCHCQVRQSFYTTPLQVFFGLSQGLTQINTTTEYQIGCILRHPVYKWHGTTVTPRSFRTRMLVEHTRVTRSTDTQRIAYWFKSLFQAQNTTN